MTYKKLSADLVGGEGLSSWDGVTKINIIKHWMKIYIGSNLRVTGPNVVYPYMEMLAI